MVEIKTEVDTSVLQKKTKEASKRIKDLRKAFIDIDRDFRKSNIKFFSLVGTGKYEPLTSLYSQRKRKLAGRNLPILVGAKPSGGESGALRDSMTKKNARGVVRNITPSSLQSGTDLFYAKFVQRGTSKMPARPFAILDKPRVKRYVNIIDAEVNSQLDEAGFRNGS